MCPHSYLILFLLLFVVWPHSSFIAGAVCWCDHGLISVFVCDACYFCFCLCVMLVISVFVCAWCLLFLFLFVRDACYFCFVPGQPRSVWGRERSWCGVSWSMSGQLVEPRNRSVWSLCCACSSPTPAWSTSTWDMSRVSTATYVRKSRTSAAEPFLVITVFNRSCVPVWPCPLRLWRLSHLQNHASSACLIRDPLSQ